MVLEPEHADPSLCGGSAGAVGWPGAFGGWWRADPADRSVRIFLCHPMLDFEQLSSGIGLGVYAARAHFQELTATSAT